MTRAGRTKPACGEVVATERELLRAEEAAVVLGIGRSKVFEMLRAGELPVIRLGRSVRIPRQALAVWIEERTEQPGSRPWHWGRFGRAA
jgi:excisionase family DNA binding protein